MEYAALISLRLPVNLETRYALHCTEDKRKSEIQIGKGYIVSYSRLFGGAVEDELLKGQRPLTVPGQRKLVLHVVCRVHHD